MSELFEACDDLADEKVEQRELLNLNKSLKAKFAFE